MRLDCSHTYTNNADRVKLVAESFEEPNYGRTFWRYKFFVDGLLVENELIDYYDEGLYTNLDSFTFNSEDDKYVFIPKYKPVIYNVDKKEFNEIKLPFKNNHELDFVKNYFHKNKLIIVYRNAIIIVNLNLSTTTNLRYSSETIFIENVKHINDEEIEVDYRDLVAYEFKKKKIKL